MTIPTLPPRIKAIVEHHALEHHIPVANLYDVPPGWRNRVAWCRRAIIHELRDLDFTYHQIARCLQIDHSTCVYAVSRPLQAPPILRVRQPYTEWTVAMETTLLQMADSCSLSTLCRVFSARYTVIKSKLRNLRAEQRAQSVAAE